MQTAPIVPVVVSHRWDILPKITYSVNFSYNISTYFKRISQWFNHVVFVPRFRPIQKRLFPNFYTPLNGFPCFQTWKSQKSQLFDLKCRESLPYLTSRWVISYKIIKNFKILEPISTESDVTCITHGHHGK